MCVSECVREREGDGECAMDVAPDAHLAMRHCQVCVCVCERERERERVCVCVRERERVSERGREREKVVQLATPEERQQDLHNLKGGRNWERRKKR